MQLKKKDVMSRLHTKLEASSEKGEKMNKNMRKYMKNKIRFSLLIFKKKIHKHKKGNKTSTI